MTMAKAFVLTADSELSQLLKFASQNIIPGRSQSSAA